MILDDQAIQDAIEFNGHSANLLGWAPVRSEIIAALNESMGALAPVRPEQFVLEIAKFQAAHGLMVDGKVGRSTIAGLRSAFPSVDDAIRARAAGVSTSPDAEEYRNLYATMTVHPGDIAAARHQAARLHKDRPRYIAVGSQVRIPWHVVGLVHMRESNFDFSTYLHNGDPLQDRAGNPLRTTHVPRGVLCYTWEESAVHALTSMPKYGLRPIVGDVAAELEFLERYNGLGYRRLRMPTPYLWAGSNHYTSGKFTGDGHFDQNAVDRQLGCAVVRAEIAKLFGLS